MLRESDKIILNYEITDPNPTLLKELLKNKCIMEKLQGHTLTGIVFNENNLTLQMISSVNNIPFGLEILKKFVISIGLIRLTGTGFYEIYIECSDGGNATGIVKDNTKATEYFDLLEKYFF